MHPWVYDVYVKHVFSWEHDYFIVKPDPIVPVFSYNPSVANLKFTTIAGAFPAEAGLDSVLNTKGAVHWDDDAVLAELND